MGYLSLVGVGLFVLGTATQAEDRIPDRPAQKIALPGVEGRIDHMAIDLKGHRLFVAALGNNSLEVLDLAAGKHIRSIHGLHEPQGVGYVPASDLIVVANGDDGSCRVFDGQTYREKAKFDLKEDADNVRYDAHADRVYVGYGKGDLAVLNLATRQPVADIPLAGHPESFQLETKGKRVFVNVPTARQIAVVDREKNRIITTWPIEDAQANFPLALDETNHRLFIACRQPAKLMVRNCETGKQVASEACCGDADDLFYDRERRRVYVIGGEGSISVFAQEGPDQYRPQSAITTAVGARTGLFVAETETLYVAVPHRASQPSEVWAFHMRRKP